MSSLNSCSFIGRCGKQPEVRETQGGKRVASFSLAVSDKYKGKETTEWVNIVLWEGLAGVAESYLDKGDMCYVSGRMVTRKYEDKEGRERYVTEIVGEKLVLLGGKRDGGKKESSGGYEEPNGFDPSDEIPFS